MYLMDDIAAAAEVIQSGPVDPVLSIYTDMSNRLRGTPRFLLDEGAIATAVELTLGRPKVLYEAMSCVRVPYPRMWIEWLESGREKLRRTFGGVDYLVTAERPLPTRLGFLIEADKETGRIGSVTWAWNGAPARNLFEEVNFPNIGTISPYFDLDQQISQPAEKIEGFLRGNLAKVWKGNPIQMEALFKIWRTANHKPNPWGEKYFDMVYQTRGQQGLMKSMSDMLADVYGEYIIIWGIMLTLTSTRRIVDYRSVDVSKLNKARIKRKQIPLLDHTKVIMRTYPHLVEGQRRQPLGFQRKSPRIHMVSSYLSHRGNKHWVVQPFWRGSGGTIHRQVNVKGR